MSDLDALADRLAAVERAVTEGEADLAALEEGADLVDRIDALDERLTAVERQIADLEADTQALRGYVGNVKTVNEEIEQRADAALAKAEAVQRTLDGRPGAHEDPPVDPEAGAGWRDATDAQTVQGSGSVTGRAVGSHRAGGSSGDTSHRAVTDSTIREGNDTGRTNDGAEADRTDRSGRAPVDRVAGGAASTSGDRHRGPGEGTETDWSRDRSSGGDDGDGDTGGVFGRLREAF